MKITEIFKMKNLFTKNYWAMKGMALLVLVVMGGGVKGQVALPHYESFNYSNGQGLQTQSGWAVLNSGDDILISNGNLSYSRLPSIGKKITFNGSGIDAAKTFTQKTSGKLYFSFLLNVTSLGSLNATGGYFLGLVEGLTTTYGATIWLRSDGDGYDIGINPKTTTANTVWTSGTQSINSTNLIIASYEIVSGATNDIVKLWLNPNIGEFEDASNISATNTSTDLTNLNRLLIRQDGTNATPFIEMDELRLGSTWESVSPKQYRSKSSGNWSTSSTWENSSDSTTWVDATSVPDGNSRFINILAGHTLTVNTNTILANTNVASTGSIIVSSGNTLTIPTGNTFTLKSDANGTARIGNSAGTISGNVTVERYIPATRRAYRFLAAPVTTTTGGVFANWQESGVNASGLGIQVSGIAGAAPGGVDETSGLDKTLTGNKSMFTYDGSDWVEVTNTKTTQLTPGKGFRVLVRGDRTTNLYASSTPNPTATTIKATGTVGQGTITLTGLVTGFNLLGNPYPSAIDWDASGWQTARRATNVYDAIYIYDPSRTAATSMTYPTYINNAGTLGCTNIIQSGQAFFINTDPGASISFLEAYKSTEVTGGFFRSALPEMMRVTYMQNNEHLDDIVIRYNDDAQASFDPRFDAISMGGDANGLASFKNADRLAIHTRPTAVGDE
jgi:hypothetical protein